MRQTYCKPKYQGIWGALILAGGAVVVVMQWEFPLAPHWISEAGDCLICFVLIYRVLTLDVALMMDSAGRPGLSR